MMSKFTRYKDSRLIFPVVLFLLTTIYLISAFQIRPQVDEGLVGPAFIPVLASLFMYVALGFVARTILRDKEKEQEDESSFWLLGQMVFATAIYIFLFKVLGYAIMTFIYVYTLFYIFDLKENSQIKRIMYSAVITGVFYVLYSVIFQVRLPVIQGVL